MKIMVFLILRTLLIVAPVTLLADHLGIAGELSFLGLHPGVVVFLLLFLLAKPLRGLAHNLNQGTDQASWATAKLHRGVRQSTAR
jgi:hypothetical protein